MLKNRVEFYLKLIFLLSFTAIISAYFIEYILGHQPCNLCLIERIPYIISVIILSIIFISKKNQKYLILLLIINFFFSLVISLYHFGIEQNLFQESLLCDIKNSSSILSKEDLLKELQKKVVSCKDVTFRIFGFSLTSINILLNLMIIILLTKIFISYDKKK